MVSSAGLPGSKTVEWSAYGWKILLPARRHSYRGSRAGSFIRVTVPERFLTIPQKNKNQELHHEEDRRGKSSKPMVALFCDS